MHLVNTTP